MRECTECKVVKPWTDFHKNHNGKNGCSAACKECRAILKRAYMKGVRVTRVKPETMTCRECHDVLPYDEFHDHKGGKEAICMPCHRIIKYTVYILRQENPIELAQGCYVCHEDTKLELDHDHATNEFRGWACRSCNMRLRKPYSHQTIRLSSC